MSSILLKMLNILGLLGVKTYFRLPYVAEKSEEKKISVANPLIASQFTRLVAFTISQYSTSPRLQLQMIHLIIAVEQKSSNSSVFQM